MEDMAGPLLQDFLTGQWGMVTNSTSLEILGEATSYDVIEARAWVGEVVGSSFDTHLEFSKVRPDQSVEPLAWGKVRATWVQLVRYGVPSPRPFPDYVQQYLDLFAPEREGPNDPPPVSTHLTNIRRGEVVYRKPPGIGPGKNVWSETFPTTLEEANLVGNVYYGNYFIWQGRVRDMFLHSCVPEMLRTSKSSHELVCLGTRMDYLREAMPFDRIYAVMSVDSVYRCGATLNFEFFRTYPDGKKEKLSVGRQEVAWVERGADGLPQSAPWPEPVVTVLAQPEDQSIISASRKSHAATIAGKRFLQLTR